jgi:hypothetical protein
MSGVKAKISIVNYQIIGDVIVEKGAAQ